MLYRCLSYSLLSLPWSDNLRGSGGINLDGTTVFWRRGSNRIVQWSMGTFLFEGVAADIATRGSDGWLCIGTTWWMWSAFADLLGFAFIQFLHRHIERVVDLPAIQIPCWDTEQGVDAGAVGLNGCEQPHLIHLVKNLRDGLAVALPQAGKFHLRNDDLPNANCWGEAFLLIFLRIGCCCQLNERGEGFQAVPYLLPARYCIWICDRTRQ